MKIRKGDIVEVITGNDLGKRGRVLSVLRGENRAVVEGVNSVYKHLRPSRNDPKGGRIQREAPVHVSNLLPVCGRCHRAVRVKGNVIDGRRVRVCAKCGAAMGQ